MTMMTSDPKIHLQGHFCLVFWLLAISGTTHGRFSNNNRKSPPHIIFIVADDLGWNDVSWHNPMAQTPNMEKLARSGVILEQSYVLPRCTPTRAALLTGRHPYTYGRQGRVIKPQEPAGVPLKYKFVSQVLKKEGYSTHAVGKWHVGYCAEEYTPLKRGFDSFYGYYGGSQDYFTYTHGGGVPPDERSGCKNRCHEFGLDLHNNTTPDPTKRGKYSTHVFTSQVEDLLRKRDPRQPMFLYLAYQSVHTPLQVPPEYMRGYRHVKHKKRKTFLSMVSALDEAVGRVAKALHTTGHYKNSVIIFTTDNGGAVQKGGNNWPLCGKKGTLLEGATRGIAFVHSPLLKKPYVSNKLIHATDWYNTLIGLAGGKLKKNTDGFDQWAAISKSTTKSPRNKMVYSIDRLDDFQAAVRDGKYKLLIGEADNLREWTLPPEDTNVRRHRGKAVKIPLSDNSSTYLDFDELPILFNTINSTSTGNSISSLQDLTFENTEAMPEIAARVNWSHPVFPVNLKNAHLVNPIDGKLSEFDQSVQYSDESSEYDETLWEDDEYTHETIFTDRDDTSHLDTSFLDDYEDNEGSPFIHSERTNNTIFTPRDLREGRSRTRNKAKMRKNRDKKEKKKHKKMMRKREYVVEEATDWVTFKDLGLSHKNYHRLKKYINKDTKLGLFNIKDDPEERRNVAKKNVTKVKHLLKYLQKKIKNYVKAKILPNVRRANPRYSHNVWTPGWCKPR